MDVNFGKRAPFTVGVEEEFQLVDETSYDLVSRFDEVEEEIDRAIEVKAELLKSTLEVATHVHGSVPEAIDESRDLRGRIARAAAERGTLVVSAGTHPFARYEHQEITEQERYLELIEQMQWVGQREVIFGLHVHVGLSSGHEAVAVAGALRTWLPELLALSANSPFWHGRDTGLASTRSKIFDAFPRSGLPPAYASFEEWELATDRAIRLGFFDDYTFLWYDLRLHPALGTIELRVCDAQARLASTAAIAALFQSLTALLSDRFEREGSLPIQPALLVGENKWRAVRYGLDARLVDLERDVERPAVDAVLELVERAAPYARRLGCADELAEVERICRRGSGAAEQRAVHEREGSLLAVVQRLCALTVET
ncbi:MAG TPA: YbdK family carboxylate-amine ligase [Gaiellaceae bacterium]|nr:YbdK family carboxylate-amine ligase [Gaiellaceae bacterium]